ncbi:MAG TPA: hypothetical protein VLH38_00690 [Patescibacteria group bacterium]|nr:hypothetical protein [Patescibacteria group bacterium]
MKRVYEKIDSERIPRVRARLSLSGGPSYAEVTKNRNKYLDGEVVPSLSHNAGSILIAKKRLGALVARVSTFSYRDLLDGRMDTYQLLGDQLGTHNALKTIFERAVLLDAATRGVKEPFTTQILVQAGITDPTKEAVDAQSAHIDGKARRVDPILRYTTKLFGAATIFPQVDISSEMITTDETHYTSQIDPIAVHTTSDGELRVFTENTVHLRGLSDNQPRYFMTADVYGG